MGPTPSAFSTMAEAITGGADAATHVHRAAVGVALEAVAQGQFAETNGVDEPDTHTREAERNDGSARA